MDCLTGEEGEKNFYASSRVVAKGGVEGGSTDRRRSSGDCYLRSSHVSVTAVDLWRSLLMIP